MTTVDVLVESERIVHRAYTRACWERRARRCAAVLIVAGYLAAEAAVVVWVWRAVFG